MKKLVFVCAAFMAISFASCGNKAANKAESAVEATCDSTKACCESEANCDSTKTCCDSTKVAE